MAFLRITAAFFAFVKLGPDQVPQLAFDDTIVLMGIIDDLPADLDVFIERLVAGIDHHAGKAFIDALLAQVERIAMIQMNGNGNIGQADRRLDQFFQINGVGILAGAFGNLEHHRRFFLFASLHNRLEQFHVVHVKCAQRIFALQRLGE